MSVLQNFFLYPWKASKGACWSFCQGSERSPNASSRHLLLLQSSSRYFCQVKLIQIPDLPQWQGYTEGRRSCDEALFEAQSA